MSKEKICGFAIMLAVAGHAAPAQETFTMKVAALGTAENPINRCGVLAIANEIAERSGGRIQTEEYLGGTAFANPTRLYEQAERGITDYTWAVTSYNPGRFKMAEVASLPLLVEDHVKAARVMNQTFDTFLAEEFSGVHVLAIAVVSPNQFHLKEPITSIDELSGLRLRSGASTVAAGLRAIGADPVAMPVTEQYESLQRGVVDGSVAPWATVAAFRISEVTSAHVRANFGTTIGVLALSKQFYNSLPDDLQTMIDTEFSGPEVGARFSNCWNVVGDVALGMIGESGGEIVELSDADHARLAEMVRPVIDAELDAREAEGLPAREYYQALRDGMAALD